MHNTKTLLENISKIAVAKNLKIATAESCTGGKIAGQITELAGVSAWFLGGLVSYANSVKQNNLGVSGQSLQKYGSVSGQVVSQMLNGICKTLQADVSIAVSGIAGPDGGSPEKPVGLVYIGVGNANKQNIEKCNFTGDRIGVQNQAVIKALEMLNAYLTILE